MLLIGIIGPGINNPYLTGRVDFHSFLSSSSLISIIFTSFLGVLIIKVINLFIDPVNFFGNLTEVDTEILNLITSSINFSWIKLLILYAVTLSFSYIIFKNRTNK